jgi:tRNA threonylcarbamoyladenosine biosynthesis protein TsaB
MLILGVDTSGKHGSIALLRCEAESCQIIEVVPLQGGTFSAQLVPQVSALLQKHGFTKNDIGGFVVVSGPGSFTGLRVGLAAIKGLAEVLQKPIAAVSLLEALAWAKKAPGKVLTAVDAGRSEVYLGQYEVLEDGARCLNEELVSREEFLERSEPEYVLVTPDPTIADAIRTRGRPVEEVERPRSDVIAQIGWRKIRAGETISPVDLEANYIRRSDAEIFVKSS